MRCKIDGHVHMVRLISSLLPVTYIWLETAAFDIQKIKNPDISGKEYQEGEQKGSPNVRAYVLARDGHTCQCCGKSPHARLKKDQPRSPKLRTHHIISRKYGGDRPDNMVTLCESCHLKVHARKIPCPKAKQPSMKYMAAMNTMQKYLVLQLKELFPDVHTTYGYITNEKRKALGLPKSHANDAFCVGKFLDAERLDTIFFFEKKRRHNRQIHNFNTLKGGKRKRNQAPYEIFSYRLFDKVRFEGKDWWILGRRSNGWFLLKPVDKNGKNQNVNYKKLKLLEKRKGWTVTEKKDII